ncbi:hypothetical protein D3C75_1123350 [compost metagenome]
MLDDCSDRDERHILQTGQCERLLGTDAKSGFAGGDHRIGSSRNRLYNFYIQSFLLIISQLFGCIKAGMVGVRRPVQSDLDFSQLFWSVRC